MAYAWAGVGRPELPNEAGTLPLLHGFCHTPVQAVVRFSQASHTDLVMKKEDFADLTPELRVILNEWDPLGVADLSPDEYDGLNGEVAGCLSRCSDLASFAECFANAAAGFCNDSQKVDSVAVAIYFWFTSRVADPSSRPQLRKGRRWRSAHWKR